MIDLCYESTIGKRVPGNQARGPSPVRALVTRIPSGQKRPVARGGNDVTPGRRFSQVGRPLSGSGFRLARLARNPAQLGVRERDLHGIDRDPIEVNRGREVLPPADLRAGDVSNLPWESNRFRLVIASTLFTSLLDQGVRQRAADEITRVLAKGGALLWYDLAVNNPRNPAVRKVSRQELRQLFPRLAGEIRSVTLAPPLARLVAPRSWVLATLMEAIPLLRTHLLAVLVKPR